MSKDKKKAPVEKNNKEALVPDPFEDMYKRALADYQNLEKQHVKEKQEWQKYANEQLLQSFIPVYDNLKTSLRHSSQLPEDDPWLVGVTYVVKQFAQALADNGVEEIETVGKPFDHSCMEAMSGKGDIVTKELRPGYKLNGKTIVAARVEVEEENQATNQ
jgi:molecular chaperone GrpE